MNDICKLRIVRLVHTVIWGVMASAILALPWMGYTRRFRWAAWVTVLVLCEGLVLLLNRGRCPLTDIAGRYTTRREDNFDIYLPLFLARYNKRIFSALFLLGEGIVAAALIGAR